VVLRYTNASCPWTLTWTWTCLDCTAPSRSPRQTYNQSCPTAIQTGLEPWAVEIRTIQTFPRGPLRKHPLAHVLAKSAVGGEAEAQRAFSCHGPSPPFVTQPEDPKIHFSSPNSGGGGGGGGGRRFGTLGGDDSDDGDDEPQNYFAGGERRYI
jgi:hypothetical protein